VAKATKLNVLPVVLASWSSALSAIKLMPVIFISVTIFLAILASIEAKVLDKLSQDALNSQQFILPFVAMLGFAIVSGFILAVLAIAVHRYVLLGEKSTFETYTGNWPRYLRFVIITSLVIGLIQLPGLQVGLEMTYSFDNKGFLGSALLFTRYGLPIFLIFFVLATMSLFPAIAVDARDATIENALADSWPNLGRIAVVVTCCVMPILAINLLMVFLFTNAKEWINPYYVFIAIKTFPNILWTTVLAATASYIYSCYAMRLGRPAELVVG
jgi:hypothetical protein